MPHQSDKEPVEIEYSDLGYEIRRYRALSSTNQIAKEIARNSNKGRIVVLADTQFLGRGRLGRRWFSPKGGVWLSIILRPKISPEDAQKLTFIASSAVAVTIEKMFGIRTEVKWPNDVLINARKVCGILTETSLQNGDVEFAVIGIGLNANVDLEALPAFVRDNSTSLKHELGHKISRRALIENVLKALEHRYRFLQQGLWLTLLQEWKGMASFLGEKVKITSFDDVLTGEALDVDEDGALIIRLESGVLREILVGDVTLLRNL
jgi:BirA family biotin operon repressor/biotin-[acetyl-CoA-carboxylase] ligase